MRHKNLPAARSPQTPATHTANANHGVQPRGSAPALHIRIERLTLEGYSIAEQKRFSNSLQSTLAELGRNSRHSAWRNAGGLRLNRLDAGSLPEGATPEIAARNLATRIFEQLAPRRRQP